MKNQSIATLPEVGKKFSGMQVLSCCGRGAFGIVYLAQNPLGDKIVIKVISSPVCIEQELAGLRHYMAVAGKHPSLLKILHIGEMENGFYYTMEAADNCGDPNTGYRPATLRNLFKLKRKFSVDEAISITRELLAGVKVMHEANLIHRDIKPDNIIFVNGRAKLSDPGLVVSVGEKASLAGTVGFIPPEAINGKVAADKKFDLYALGKVFYCMVTGMPAKEYPALPLDMRIDVCRRLYPPLTCMCCQDPRKRFKNVDEFLEGLPEKSLEPNLLSQKWENFNSWRICNRETFRNLLLAITLLVLAGVFMMFGKQCIDQCWTFYHQAAIKPFTTLQTKLKSRQQLLVMQIQQYMPQKYAQYEKLQQAFANRIVKENPKAAIPDGRKLLKFLTDIARERMEEILKTMRFPGDTSDNQFVPQWLECGRIHGFLASPLADFLSAAERKSLLKRFDEMCKNYKPKYRKAFRIGQNFIDHKLFNHNMIYLPPGVVKMHHSQQTITLPYCFWICDRELTHNHIYTLLGIQPQYSPYMDTPVERIAWNDILNYCYKKTMTLKSLKILPPGYIVRPPTEVEWEYAANNGWLDTVDDKSRYKANFAAQSRGRTWPAGTHPANKLGLYDMFGNVAEIVLPLQSQISPDYLAVRGGSFVTYSSDRFERFYLGKNDKNLNYAGVRLVAAPGDMDFFDKEFHLKNQDQFEYKNQIYELFSSYSNPVSSANARALCDLAGGQLAEFPDYQSYEQIKNHIPAIANNLIIVGAQWNGNKFYWPNSQIPIDKKFLFSEEYYNQSAHPCVWLQSGKMRLVKKQMRNRMFICQWSKAEYKQLGKRRPSQEKLPLELVRFSYNNRLFILFASTLEFYSANRLCELMNGRLAVLDSMKLLSLAAEKCQAYKDHRILLGGYFKYGKNYWITGKEINRLIHLDPDPDLPVPTTRNRMFITLKSGRLHSSQSSCMFLCEWNESSTSSHLR
ncbi:MAG: hypothetical protein E7052_10010 [Lentisphaerae bacterium]|nr:hypothetical protein [Lentisphaerota bacterium]